MENNFKFKLFHFIHSLLDTSNFSQYQDGGIAMEVKKPTQIAFNSLEDSLVSPYGPGTTELPICNW